MTKKRNSLFICQKCGHETSKWLGKCPQCQEWNTFEEETPPLKKSHDPLKQNHHIPLKINDIRMESQERSVSNIDEFDRVLGGGLIKGSLTLIGGEPGIGKSTLILQVMGALAEKYPQEKVLYVSGEESYGQIANRSNRLNVNKNNLYILNETNWQNISSHISKIHPRFVVIDSIQTTISTEAASGPGSITQIREVTYEIMNMAKANGITALIIGHITKEGVIAGPKILEHMVDTVVYFEGDQYGHYRILRSIKNRFGNTNEVGIFEMSTTGLSEVPNPAQYFLDTHLENAEGRTQTCIMEGTRILFVEIQSLVLENKFGAGRRTTQGLDSNRLSMLIAVVEKHCKIPIGHNDIYSNIVAGIKLKERDGDLAVCASLISSILNIIIPNDTVFVGEVGLTGEIRGVPLIEQRLQEMTKLNYKNLVISQRTAKKLRSNDIRMNVIGLDNAQDLLQYLNTIRHHKKS